MIGDLELEKWICEETWLFQEALKDLDIRLAEERKRLIALKYSK